MLIKKGAEAELYLSNWFGRKVVVKKRVAKRYRNRILDEELRKARTIREAQILHEAKKAGVPAPTLFLVDLNNTAIVMEFIDGVCIKDVLDSLPSGKRVELCRKIGILIGRLHKKGIVHGDLTTSNIILLKNSDMLYFVDFGLSMFSNDLEDRGVDIHLLKTTLNSTHHKYAEECFEAIISGYKQELPEEDVREVLNKVREIEMRGRYIEREKI